MARKHRKVFMHTWNDERFRQLDPPGKLLALYILTGQSNRIGCFCFSPALASEHTGIPLEPSPNVPETFRDGFGMVSGGLKDLLDRVCQTLGWRWDAGARVLFIPSWWKHNPPENVNVLKGALADAEELPQSPLVQEFWQNGRHLPPGMADVLAKRSGNVTPYVPGTIPKPSPIQEQEQEQELNTPPNPQRGNESAESEPEPKRGRRKKAGAAEADPLFASFYQAYPRKTAKADAAKAFAKIDPDETLLARMLAAIAVKRKSDDWTRENGRFIPYPATWLNQRRWEDEPPDAVPPARSNADSAAAILKAMI